MRAVGLSSCTRLCLTIFAWLQDDVDVHVPAHHVAAFCGRVRRLISERSRGEVLQVVYRGKKLQPPRRIDDTDGLAGKISAMCERIPGLVRPAAYETHVCAFVLVSRSAIQRHACAVYEALHAWHLNSESPGASPPTSVRNRRGASEVELAPWVMEHTWQLLFFYDADVEGTECCTQGWAGSEKTL